ncbi:hypothetical protein B7463_g1502, partial [Scytalidium lignicola]
MVFTPMTRLQCCPTSDGAAAAVIVSQAFLDKRPHLKSQAVLITGQKMATDPPDLFDRSAIGFIGYKMTEYAGKEALKEAGITPNNVSVVELHDCFSANEMCVIDALGLSSKGKAHELVRSGGITYGGKYVINPLGGLISKGHPLGATGLAQCTELVWHLQGWANNRQVKDTEYCHQHNLGLGGAVIVTITNVPMARKSCLSQTRRLVNSTDSDIIPLHKPKGSLQSKLGAWCPKKASQIGSYKILRTKSSPGFRS